MKFWAAIFFAVTGVALFLRAADDRVPPSLPANVKEMRASEFSSEQYFDPPNETNLKMRFTGSALAPLPGGLQEVRQVRIELFNTNGLTRVVAEAPQCELSPFDGVASSAGKLEMRSGDGKFRLTGDGFLFRQNELTNEMTPMNGMTLTISNHVHTVLKVGTNNFDSFIKL